MRSSSSASQANASPMPSALALSDAGLLPATNRVDCKLAMPRGALHAIIKQVFSQTAARLRQISGEFNFDAEQLMRASAHWLRHTAGSHMANHAVDLRHVRDNLGHEWLSTTSRYLHSTDEQRHTETTLKHKVN